MPDDLAQSFSAGSFSLVVPNTRASVQFVRTQLATFVRRIGLLPTDVAEDVVLAVGEALANSAEHGHRPDGTIALEARIANGGLEIVVTDDGRGFAQRPHAAPDVYATRGFGIHIMRSLMDVVEFRDDGRRVYLFKRFPI